MFIVGTLGSQTGVPCQLVRIIPQLLESCLVTIHSCLPSLENCHPLKEWEHKH